MYCRFFKNTQNVFSKGNKRDLFIISLTYKVPLLIVDRHLEAHRQFLTKHIDSGVFIACGRKVPRTGGVILASISDSKALEVILADDPFKIHNIANYSVIEFTPSLHSKGFEKVADIDKEVRFKK
jgi:uncharacterized protein YciI